MKEQISKYTSQLSEIINFIKKDLIEYFKEVDYLTPNNEIQIIEINNELHLDRIIIGSSFYVILTDYVFGNNKCLFEYKKHKAIYRGHSYNTKKRLLSHLANKKYNSLRRKNEPNYKVCLKIEDGVNGININEKPYNTWNWIVIIHKMKKSNTVMREQAEYAFDKI
ncbi:hypothetical protein ABMY20_00920 [Tenacibaculum sp. SSH1-16]|uniref:hypothetical protein n=1 Tax=Tenacibaculum sp. SSH1-16 TaxID=3136667 RepID=UPI0032C41D81